MADIRTTDQIASTVANASCGKAAAVALFLHDILPIEAVARLFARHPEWRAA